jgi:hypothetical protein
MSKPKRDPGTNRNGFKVEGRLTHTIEAMCWAGFSNDGNPRWKPCTIIARKIKF